MQSTLEELLAFRTVVDTGSITAAALQLDQTTSGISRSLSRLEKKLATTLLRRTTRKLELTEEGARFLAQARAVLEALDAAEEALVATPEIEPLSPEDEREWFTVDAQGRHAPRFQTLQ